MSSVGDLLVAFGQTPRRQRSVHTTGHLHPVMRLGALLSLGRFRVQRRAAGSGQVPWRVGLQGVGNVSSAVGGELVGGTGGAGCWS
jgi:hypothetical protein